MSMNPQLPAPRSLYEAGIKRGSWVFSNLGLGPFLGQVCRSQLYGFAVEGSPVGTTNAQTTQCKFLHIKSGNHPARLGLSGLKDS